jgi:tRNA isopentenyl-2-thiomethyl-A-37 hydroxylase MiaE
MKKLDEIMELMADEMKDFKTAVLEFQKLSGQLVKMSIPISTEALEKNLNTFLQKQELEKGKTDEILKEIDRKLKRARIIPNYLLILLGISGIIALGSVGYFGYTSKEKVEENFEVYRTIMESQNKHYEDYFAAYPEIQEAYCEWIQGGYQSL